jgi:hypothetical protein
MHKFRVLGLKTALVVAMTATSIATAQTASGNSIAGEWDGMIQNLHLVFVFGQTPEGKLTLKLTSTDQGNAVVPVDSVSLDSGKLDVEMKAIGASYVATLSATGDSFTGTWAQGSANLPLTLRRPGAQAAAFTLKPRTIGTVPMEPCRTMDGNVEGLCGTVFGLGEPGGETRATPCPEGDGLAGSARWGSGCVFSSRGGAGAECYRNISGDGVYERYPQRP